MHARPPVPDGTQPSAPPDAQDTAGHNSARPAPESKLSSAARQTWAFLTQEVSIPGLSFPSRPRPEAKTKESSAAEPKVGFWEATKTYLGLVKELHPKIFWRRTAMAVADAAALAAPWLALPPLATSFANSGFSVKTALITTALTAVWAAKDWANRNRDAISDEFFRKTWRAAEDRFLDRYMSRSIATHSSGEFLDRVTKVREQGNRMATFTERTFELATFAGATLLSLVGVAVHSPTIAVVFGLTGTLTIANFIRFARDFSNTETQVSDTRRRYWYTRSDVMDTSGVKEFKLMEKERVGIKKASDADTALATPRLEDSRRLALRNGLPAALSWVSKVGVMIGAGMQTWAGSMSSTSMVSLLAMCVSAELSLATLSRFISGHLQDLDVVRESLSIDKRGEPERIPGKQYARLPLDKPPVIKVEKLGYTPPANAKTGTPSEAVFQDLSITLEPGKVYALCGKSGAGKTTLVRLLTRETLPTSGKITLDDNDLNDVDPDDRRHLFRVMSQDPHGFEASKVGDVIALGIPPAANRDTAMRGAVADAEVDFIDHEALSKVTIGRNFDDSRDFSGGERQRIALARTLAGNARVLILDEPTSKVDKQHERSIFAKLLARDPENPRTVVLISHHYVNLREADCIFFFEKGKGIVEQGTHKELLAMNGQYAEMYRAESGLYD